MAIFLQCGALLKIHRKNPKADALGGFDLYYVEHGRLGKFNFFVYLFMNIDAILNINSVN